MEFKYQRMLRKIQATHRERSKCALIANRREKNVSWVESGIWWRQELREKTMTPIAERVVKGFTQDEVMSTLVERPWYQCCWRGAARTDNPEGNISIGIAVNYPRSPRDTGCRLAYPGSL